MSNWWDEAPLATPPPAVAPPPEIASPPAAALPPAPESNWWDAAPLAPQQTAQQNPISLWQSAQRMVKQYANDVLTGKYAQQGLDNLSGAYKWDPNLSAIENARQAARDPASLAQSTGLGLSFTPGPIAAVRPPVPPTAIELKAAGSAGFDAAHNLGVEFRPDAVSSMGDAVKSIINSEGLIPVVAPTTHGLLDSLANPPTGSTVSSDALKVLRTSLSRVGQSGSASGEDKLAAAMAIRGLDRFVEMRNPDFAVPGNATQGTMDALADTWGTARGNYAAAQRSNDITGALDRANTGITEKADFRAAAANSGTNLDNALRQRVASFLEKPSNISGYSDPEIAALKDFVQGSAGREALRKSSNFFGGGGGLLRALWSMAGGGAGAALTNGSPLGAMVGSAVPYGVASALKAGQNALATRQMGVIDELLRSRSPLYQGMLQNPPLPGFDAQALLLRGIAAPSQGTPGMWGAPPTQR